MKTAKRKLSIFDFNKPSKPVINSDSGSDSLRIEEESTESINEAVDSHSSAILAQLRREGFDVKKWKTRISTKKIISYKDTFNSFDRRFKN